MSALLTLIPAWAWVALIGLKLIRVHDVRAQMAKAEAISRATGEKLVACRVTRTNLLEQTIDQNRAVATLRQAAAGRASVARAGLGQVRSREGVSGSEPPAAGAYRW